MKLQVVTLMIAIESKPGDDPSKILDNVAQAYNAFEATYTRQTGRKVLRKVTTLEPVRIIEDVDGEK